MKVTNDFMGMIEQMGWVADSTCTKPGTVLIGGNNGEEQCLLPSNAHCHEAEHRLSRAR